MTFNTSGLLLDLELNNGDDKVYKHLSRGFAFLVVHLLGIRIYLFYGLSEDPFELVIILFVFLSHLVQLLLITILLDIDDDLLYCLSKRLAVGLFYAFNDVNDIPIVFV